MHLISNRKTLAGQLAILIALAFAAAAVLFFAADNISSKVIGRYLEASDYVGRQNAAYAEKMQEFVTANDISSTDRKELGRWAREQKRIWFEIYQDTSWIYTSGGPFEGESAESDFQATNSEFPIEFADGAFDVYFGGNYTYQFYSRALIAELDVCFAIFFGIVMAGVSRMIKYIRKLRYEIEILEGGNLEYEVTVKGRNELAALGESIDSFRKSILQQFAKEEELRELNSRMITDMSHDIRTPLTAVMIYTEAIKRRKYEDEEQLMQYVERIDSKLHSIKYLTDRIFEYSLEKGESGLPEPGMDELAFEDAFSDALSGSVEYLEQQGFRTDVSAEWYELEISAHGEDVDRILSNIISNIIKYADRKHPVKIMTISEEGYAGFAFENAVDGAGGEDRKAGSSGIGLRNIMRLAERAGGYCDIKSDANSFGITVMFRAWQAGSAAPELPELRTEFSESIKNC